MLATVAMCCQLLPSAANFCNVLPTDATCCELLPHDANCCHLFLTVATCCQLLPCVVNCCYMLPTVVTCCQLLLCVANCNYVLPTVTTCCQQIVWFSISYFFLLQEDLQRRIRHNPYTTNPTRYSFSQGERDPSDQFQLLPIVVTWCQLSPHAANCWHMLRSFVTCYELLPRVTNCCHVLPTVANCCHVFPTVATCCQLLPIVSTCHKHMMTTVTTYCVGWGGGCDGCLTPVTMSTSLLGLHLPELWQ